LDYLYLFKGGSKYEFIKQVSGKNNLAPSTIRYSLKKLKEAGIIDSNGKIELTKKGRILVGILRRANEI